MTYKNAVIIMIGILAVAGGLVASERYLVHSHDNTWGSDPVTTANVVNSSQNSTGSKTANSTNAAPSNTAANGTGGTSIFSSGGGGAGSGTSNSTGGNTGSSGFSAGSSGNSTQKTGNISSAKISGNVSGKVDGYSVVVKKYNGSYGVVEVHFQVTNRSSSTLQFQKGNINGQPSMWLMDGSNVFTFSQKAMSMYNLPDSPDQAIAPNNTAKLTMYFLTNQSPSQLKQDKLTFHLSFPNLSYAFDWSLH